MASIKDIFAGGVVPSKKVVLGSTSFLDMTLEDFLALTTPGQIALSSICEELMELCGVGYNLVGPDGEKNKDKLFLVAGEIKDLGFNPGQVPATMKEAVHELVFAVKNAQVTVSHLNSWLTSHDLPSSLTSKLSPILPLIAASDKAIAGAPPPTKWLQYRLSMQSTSTLCRRVVDALGDDAPLIFTKLELDAIRASHQFTVEHNIPLSAISKTYVYLETFDNLPQNWYQGKAAVAEYNPARAKTLSRVLVAYEKKSIDMDLLEGAQDGREVLALSELTDASKDVASVMKRTHAERALRDAALTEARKLKPDILKIAKGADPERFIGSVKDILEESVRLDQILTSTAPQAAKYTSELRRQ